MISVRGALAGGLGVCGSRSATEALVGGLGICCSRSAKGGQPACGWWFGGRFGAVGLVQGVSSSGTGASLFAGWCACSCQVGRRCCFMRALQAGWRCGRAGCSAPCLVSFFLLLLPCLCQMPPCQEDFHGSHGPSHLAGWIVGVTWLSGEEPLLADAQSPGSSAGCGLTAAGLGTRSWSLRPL